MMQQELRYQQVKKANILSSWINLFLALLKTLFGIIGNSPALLADGLHSFSDLLANGLVAIASSFGRAAPDDNHPYGHYRFETIGTFSLGLFLMIVAFVIAFEAFEAIIHHHLPVPNAYTVWVAVVSIIANESIFRYLLQVAKKVESSLLKANAYHSRADGFASIIVLVGILGALAGFPFFDAIAAVLVAGFILKIGLSLAWQAVYELSDAGMDETELKAIEHLILGLSGVRHLHRLRTRKMADKIFLDVHVLIAPYASASEGHYIGETVRYHLSSAYPNIEDITVHIDTEDHPETQPNSLLPARRELVETIEETLTQVLKPEEILNMDFYYFHYPEQHIEVMLTLSESLLQQNSAILWHRLINKHLAALASIEKIHIAFALKAEFRGVDASS